MRRKPHTGNPLNTVPARSKAFDPRDWAAHSDEFLVDQLLDVLEHGDPHGEATPMAREVTRRGLTALAEATVRRRKGLA